MSRAFRVPSYCRHKSSGQAVTRIDGRDHYLGRYGSSESHEEYERLISEWRRQGPAKASAQIRDPFAGNDVISITDLVDRYRKFAETYYVREGRPTTELTCMRYAIRPLRQLFGSRPAREFGPLALKVLQQHLVDQGLCRTHINARINRVKRFFKWAVSEELIPSSVHEALRTVPSLRFGRTAAREKEPVRPVPDSAVTATMPFLSPQVAAMVQLQRLTGMRPCEVVIMRLREIDRSFSIWIYEPLDHKNRWRGHQRQVPLGPRAQEVLRPFLSRGDDEFLFSPTEAERWRSEIRRKLRKTSITPSQAKRKPKTTSKRAKRVRYDVDSYRRAITYATIKASKLGTAVPHWYPLQLRHARATEIRHRFGIEAAQVSLGHARADVTQIYAERDVALAAEIAGKIG